ncbi:MAG TPA: histidine kinase [Roseiflexaceae bacterium]|nr:histidine kinase [Roseiflexaceae bacterium]
MNATLRYRVLTAVGALAALASVLLAVLLRLQGIDLGFPSDLLAALLCYCLGAFAVWQRPQLVAARRLLLAGVLYVGTMAMERLLSLVAVRFATVPWFWVGNALDQALQLAVLCALLALFAVFPDGMYQRRYERRLVWTSWVLVPTLPLLLLVTRPTLFINSYVISAGSNQTNPSPLFVPALAISESLAQALWWAPFPLLVLGAVALLALRYRRFDHERRLQIIWPLLAALSLGLALATTILSVLGEMPQVVPVVLFHATIMLLPVTLAIGLLRHRLFDIEVVLRKSLIYGGLWMAITLGYLGLTAVLGITAGARLPLGLVVLLTIIATQLFQPARRRLERLADRWVFGERLSGYELLTRFGATLEGAFDLGELLPQVAAAVRQGLGVSWVRVSLRQGPGIEDALEPVAAEGIGLHDPATPAATAPLVHAGEQIGAIECGPKLEGQHDAKDHELLATLGRQTALAIHNARLTAELAERLEQIERQAHELAASRTRIVQASEEERRRIERNIHDGVQQSLVALLAKIRLARNHLARDPRLAECTLSEVQADTRQIVEDLRQLAHGIHPPILSDRGLLEAIEARVARLPIAVTIHPDGVARATRYAAEVEGAAYFFVCEGLANVLKHAAAQHTTIRLSATPCLLSVAVIDDGRGFDPSAIQPTGLRGLLDRIEALGGSVRIDSHPAAGTTLLARLPVHEVTNAQSTPHRDS